MACIFQATRELGKSHLYESMDFVGTKPRSSDLP